MQTKQMNKKIFICVLLTAFLFSAAAFSRVGARAVDNSTTPPDRPNLGDVPILTGENPILLVTQDNSATIADNNSTLTARTRDNVTMPARDSSLASTQDGVNGNPLVTAQLQPDYSAIIVFVAAVLGTVIGSTILAVAKFRKETPRRHP